MKMVRMIRECALMVVLMAGCTDAPGTADPPKLTQMVAAGRRAAAEPTAHGDPDAKDQPDPFGPDKEIITVTIRNECSGIVRIYFGHRPQPGGSTFVTMNGNSQLTMPMVPSDEVWLLDDEERPVARVAVAHDDEEIVVDESCVEIDARRSRG